MAPRPVSLRNWLGWLGLGAAEFLRLRGAPGRTGEKDLDRVVFKNTGLDVSYSRIARRSLVAVPISGAVARRRRLVRTS